jgi:hypothetical protein
MSTSPHGEGVKLSRGVKTVSAAPRFRTAHAKKAARDSENGASPYVMSVNACDGLLYAISGPQAHNAWARL